MIRFLANENFPVPSIRILRNRGYFVKSISEENRGITDEEVMNIAIIEQLIILTFDRDYGELIFKYKKDNPPSVVYFRIKGNNPQSTGSILLKILENRHLQLESHFTVVEENGIRQRKLI